MTPRITTLMLLGLVLLSSCLGSISEPEALCAPPIVGKVVSSHPPCAGIVIQVTGGSYEASHLQESYTDSFGNTFSNVFRVANPCEMSDKDVAWLSDKDNVGVEFTFVVLGPAVDESCATCKILVELPKVSHRIVRASAECQDHIIVD